jgi:hypothetical protein
MDNSKNLSLHYWALAGVMALGVTLRFCNLDLKPLWLDEVLTALLSLGHRYKDVPLEVVFPASTLQELFTLQPTSQLFRDCPSRCHRIHPSSPVFLLNASMVEWGGTRRPYALVETQSASCSVGGGCDRSYLCFQSYRFFPKRRPHRSRFHGGFSFAVYLSQEARHYTLPMLLIILALLGLMHIQYALYNRQQLPKPLVWLLWGIINSIGCYVHYFFILAFIAQLLTLTGLMYGVVGFYPRELAGGYAGSRRRGSELFALAIRDVGAVLGVLRQAGFPNLNILPPCIKPF